jgi:DNA-binding NtrC family response regulator
MNVLALEDHVVGSGALIGSSPAMREVHRVIGKVALSDHPVMVAGETGTGKELVARAVHAASPHRHHPFVAVNCAAIPGTLFESEIFGYEKGAFTGADRARAGALSAAGAGTIFFDELGELPLDQQAKLLRVVERRAFVPVGTTTEVPIRARIVCATNANLSAEVEARRFRADLRHRLDVLRVNVPPLRMRGGDALELLRAFNSRMEKPARFTEAAAVAVAAYSWPGNVRELQNFVRRVAVMVDGETDSADVVQHLDGAPSDSTVESAIERVISTSAEGTAAATLNLVLKQVALAKTGGNKTAAARLLGVDRRAFG